MCVYPDLLPIVEALRACQEAEDLALVELVLPLPVGGDGRRDDNGDEECREEEDEAAKHPAAGREEGGVRVGVSLVVWGVRVRCGGVCGAVVVRC